MAGSIYTYALIKALYDEGREYIDSFWPFAVEVIPSNQSVTSIVVQRNVSRRFELEIPLHVIEIILARAIKRDYLRRVGHKPTGSIKYRITKAGLSYSTNLETEKEVERRINALLKSMRKFFEEKSVSIDFDLIREILLNFLHKNIDFLIERINPSLSPVRVDSQKLKDYDRYLFEYVKLVEKQEPDTYRTMQDMVMGSIISILLYVKNPEDIATISTKKFSHCQVFLDTNFVFSILGLDTEEFNEPARELLNLLKRNDTDLKVFSFTVDEISRVINFYSRESYRYPSNIRVSTLYSTLKGRGWSKTDAREFIINLEQILQKQGITIEWMRDINLNNYTPDEGLRDTIKKYKPAQGPFHQNHDLAAIKKIYELREKTMRRIEDSKAFF
jgi:hypothetical protein